MARSLLPELRAPGSVFHDTGTALYLDNIYNWVGSADDFLPGRPELFEWYQNRYWVSSARGGAHDVPRSSFDAISHIVSYLSFTHVHPTVDWANKGTAMVARAYGVPDPMTYLIPRKVPGPKGAAMRQFRWVRRNFPAMAVTAPSTDSFGPGVPIGAILYWDEDSGSTGFGRTAIAAGYKNNLLMCFTASMEMSCNALQGASHRVFGSHGMGPCRHVALVAAPSYGCVGWTVPTFFAPPQNISMRLWEEPGVEHPSPPDKPMDPDPQSLAPPPHASAAQALGPPSVVDQVVFQTDRGPGIVYAYLVAPRAAKGDTSIDWGDGTVDKGWPDQKDPDLVHAASLKEDVTLSEGVVVLKHEYQANGNYTISVSGTVPGPANTTVALSTVTYPMTVYTKE